MVSSQEFVPLSDLERQLFTKLVPKDDFLRQLEPLIDWEQFRPLLLEHYCGERGRPPLLAPPREQARARPRDFLKSDLVADCFAYPFAHFRCDSSRSHPRGDDFGPGLYRIAGALHAGDHLHQGCLASPSGGGFCRPRSSPPLPLNP